MQGGIRGVRVEGKGEGNRRQGRGETRGELRREGGKRETRFCEVGEIIHREHKKHKNNKTLISIFKKSKKLLNCHLLVYQQDPL